MASKKQRPSKRGSGNAHPVEQLWPHLQTNVAIKPIIDDPVSNATKMDNTEELAVKQRRLDDKRTKRVPADEPGGAGTFEPSGGNSKLK